MSASDAIADFIAFMTANDVAPAEEISSGLASGALIRFRCEGDSKGRKNGWAILYLDERPAGAFGNYRTNTGTLKWKSSSDRPALSAHEREALQREWLQAKENRAMQQDESEHQATLDAADMWARGEPADARHSYAINKQLGAATLATLRQLGPNLLVPLHDIAGKLWSLQTIAPDGTKRFLRGGRINGCFAIIGAITNQTREVVFVEGYATGDAVHRATGHPVIVTFNTSNLPKVARIISEARPDLTYTVFADDDEKTAQEQLERTGVYKNPGIETAEAVAAEIGAFTAYPLGRPQREMA